MNTFTFVAVVLGGIALGACSSPSPVAPMSPAAAASAVDARPGTESSGIYMLSFVAWRDGMWQEVTSLPVGSAELLLRAYVTDSTGSPAQRGTVTFEYCSKKGRPNDSTQADEAPKEACDDLGTAEWARLTSIAVDAGRCPGLGTGYACMNFGVVRNPRDVGFRFRYSPQGSGVPSGVSAAKNFTWVP